MVKKGMKNGIGRALATAMLTGVIFTNLEPLSVSAEVPAEYAAIFDAAYYADKYPDVAAACGNDEDLLFAHFVNCGMAEGRQGNAEFDVQAYKANYADLQAAFGDDLTQYYMHYMNGGKAEGRSAVAQAPKPQTTTPSSNSNTSAGKNMDDQLRWDLHAAINKYRLANGKTALENTMPILDAAQVRADEMPRRYNRIRPDGRNGDSVLDDYNVPRHYFRELRYKSYTGSVAEVIEEWSKPGQDLSNVVLYSGWTLMGVGHSERNGVHYWVIEFCDGTNVCKEGTTSEDANYLRERYQTPEEKRIEEEKKAREQRRNQNK
ncbi:MAG: hypothetical protein IKH46_14055 [Lachnospiraceae bacterium]|nr:hypothetical protein [Lachnospiraceae bacterium]